MIEYLAQVGGVFALLVGWHFVVELILRLCDDPMTRSRDLSSLFLYCSSYTLGFVPALNFVASPQVGLFSLALLFLSHLVRDNTFNATLMLPIAFLIV